MGVRARGVWAAWVRLVAVTLVALALLTANMGPVAATEHDGDAEAIALAHLDEHKTTTA